MQKTDRHARAAAAGNGEFERRLPVLIDEWKQFLRFPSLGADPAHAADCRACADWQVARLARMGFDAGLIETPGQPLVYAERMTDRALPTVLFYGHYDVQPVDPVDAWTTPPFEPDLRDGRLYARGAQDNKGQVFFFLKAVEALVDAGKPLPNLKVLIEGEEECGSRGISAWLHECGDRVGADVLMVCDTGAVASGAPTITLGLRGIAFLSFTLQGADHDLHSGVHGGVAPNPANAAAALVASLHGPDGAVAVEGFHDGIVPPTACELELARAATFDAAQYRRLVGTTPDGGERGLDVAERRGFRPALDLNGLHSGYGGPGTKTIIPASADVKLSARLVPGQDPARVLDRLEGHLRARVPPGLTMHVTDRSAGGPGLRIDPESEVVRRASAVLDAIGDDKTAFLWEGASIPIVAALAAASGAPPLLVGFGREEDRIHAPNESFAIAQFREGFLYATLFLSDLAERPA